MSKEKKGKCFTCARFYSKWCASCSDHYSNWVSVPTTNPKPEETLKPCCITNDLSHGVTTEPHWQLRMKADNCPHRRTPAKDEGEWVKCEDCPSPCKWSHKGGACINPTKDESICTCPRYDGQTFEERDGKLYCPKCGKVRVKAVVGEIEAGHPEAICQLCGRENMVWHAENELWNAVDPSKGIICPVCFKRLALEKGIHTTFKCVDMKQGLESKPTAPAAEGELIADARRRIAENDYSHDDYDGKAVDILTVENADLQATLNGLQKDHGEELAEKDKEITKLKEAEEGYANAHDDLVEIQEELEGRLNCTTAPDCKCPNCMYEAGRNIGEIEYQRIIEQLHKSLEAELKSAKAVVEALNLYIKEKTPRNSKDIDEDRVTDAWFGMLTALSVYDKEAK